MSEKRTIAKLRADKRRLAFLLARAAGCLATATDELEAMAETLGEDEEETAQMVETNRHNVDVFQRAADEARP